MKLVFFLVLFNFLICLVISCKCRIVSVEESLKNSDYVFVATVLNKEIKEDSYAFNITLKVKKSWKGFSDINKIVNAETCRESACCGFNFEIGKTYLIYAYHGNKDLLSVNSCSRTMEIKYALKELKEIKKLLKK